jgi:6,7-dimethyl-8-ribityllumazine synthase
VIAAGAVIRGQTAHFDYVCAESASGLSRLSADTGLPVINAILTVENLQQALERAGSKAGNKGSEAALVALEMIDLSRQLSGKG